jgi:hypothetical protein
MTRSFAQFDRHLRRQLARREFEQAAREFVNAAFYLLWVMVVTIVVFGCTIGGIWRVAEWVAGR